MCWRVSGKNASREHHLLLPASPPPKFIVYQGFIGAWEFIFHIAYSFHIGAWEFIDTGDCLVDGGLRQALRRRARKARAAAVASSQRPLLLGLILNVPPTWPLWATSVARSLSGG